MAKDRKKAFEEAIDTVNKEMKKKNPEEDIAVGLLSNMEADVERFSTGSLVLDSIIGGGFPKGRVIEISGMESSGKTSIALTAIANVQKENGNCVFIDVEQALDPKYAQVLGVNIDNVAFAQPAFAEDALQQVIYFAQSGVVDLIVVDSVAALIPKSEYEDELGKQQVALLPRLLAKALKKIVPLCNKNNCSVIFINQVRDNIGVMYGPKTVTPGGRALKFAASQRIEVKRSSQIKEGDDVIGNEVNFKCVKNKVSRPFGTGTTVLTYNKGINRAAEIAVVGQNLGIIKKKGQTFYLQNYQGDKLKEYPESEDGLKIGVYQKGLIENLENDEMLRHEIGEMVKKELIEKEIGFIEGDNDEE